jgi:hypothetical protein
MAGTSGIGSVSGHNIAGDGLRRPHNPCAGWFPRRGPQCRDRPPGRIRHRPTNSIHRRLNLSRRQHHATLGPPRILAHTISHDHQVIPAGIALHNDGRKHHSPAVTERDTQKIASRLVSRDKRTQTRPADQLPHKPARPSYRPLKANSNVKFGPAAAWAN